MTNLTVKAKIEEKGEITTPYADVVCLFKDSNVVLVFKTGDQSLELLINGTVRTTSTSTKSCLKLYPVENSRAEKIEGWKAISVRKEDFRIPNAAITMIKSSDPCYYKDAYKNCIARRAYWFDFDRTLSKPYFLQVAVLEDIPVGCDGNRLVPIESPSRYQPMLWLSLSIKLVKSPIIVENQCPSFKTSELVAIEPNCYLNPQLAGMDPCGIQQELRTWLA